MRHVLFLDKHARPVSASIRHLTCIRPHDDANHVSVYTLDSSNSVLKIRPTTDFMLDWNSTVNNERVVRILDFLSECELPITAHTREIRNGVLIVGVPEARASINQIDKQALAIIARVNGEPQFLADIQGD